MAQTEGGKNFLPQPAPLQFQALENCQPKKDSCESK
jgi:hypothetical protein